MKTISREKEYDFERCVTKLNHNGPFVKEDVVAAIYATNGNFAQMAICLGRRRSSVRNFVLANLDVKDIYDEVHEVFLDTVEQSHASLALGERRDRTARAYRRVLARARRRGVGA